MVGQASGSCNKPAKILSGKEQPRADAGLFVPASRPSTSGKYWRYKEHRISWAPLEVLYASFEDTLFFFLSQEPHTHCKSSSKCGRVDLCMMASSLLKLNVSWTPPTPVTAIPSSGNRPWETVLPTQHSFAKPATTEPCTVVKLLDSDWMNTNQTIIRNNEWKLARQPASTVRETAELLAHSIRQNK